MRSLIMLITATIIGGCSPTLAQQAAPASGTSSLPQRMLLSTISPPARALLPGGSSLSTVPGTIPTPGASPLGAIQIQSGTAATIAPGSIATCAAPAIGPAVPAGVIDASNAVTISGAMSSQALPGATIPAGPAFDPSTSTGACNPATAAQDASEALGNTTVGPIPGLATITGSLFSDATVPIGATEAGGPGLSPLIVVPTPTVPSASPAAATPAE